MPLRLWLVLGFFQGVAFPHINLADTTSCKPTLGIADITLTEGMKN
jgi:hypothetical protein